MSTSNDTTKYCPQCQQIKPNYEFWKRTASYDGLQWRCKQCSKKYLKTWTKINADAIQVKRKRRGLRGTGYPKFGRKHWRYALLYFRNCCAYCGTSGNDVKLTKDHIIPIDPSYELEVVNPGTSFVNIAPACLSCNMRKGKKRVGEWLENEFGKERTQLILSNLTEYLWCAWLVFRDN